MTTLKNELRHIYISHLYLAAGFKYKIYFTASVPYDFGNEFLGQKYYHNHNAKNFKVAFFFYHYACLPSSFHFCDA